MEAMRDTLMEWAIDFVGGLLIGGTFVFVIFATIWTATNV